MDTGAGQTGEVLHLKGVYVIYQNFYRVITEESYRMDMWNGYRCKICKTGGMRQVGWSADMVWTWYTVRSKNSD